MIRSEKHRRFVASLPCLVTGREGGTQAAHIRSGFYGMGIKPDDSLVVPLHYETHQEQHRIGEKKFYEPFGGVERAKDYALRLFDITGNEFLAMELIEDFRDGARYE